MTASAYRDEAAALDAAILAAIAQRRVDDFDELALRIFAHQLRYNEPYARYCGAFGITAQTLPGTWEEIVPVPSSAFKEAALCTFDPALAALAFETSGTTQGRGGKHYMESAELYEAALLAGFSDALLCGDPSPLRYLLLVPDPVERPQSSLGYMMRAAAHRFGDGRESWYLRGNLLDVDRFARDARDAAREGAGLCVAGTAFAFVELLDALEAKGIASLPLPQNSRIMETGGFKGRTRIVQREVLYASLARLFAIDERCIVAEYGMTELSSQYYDDPETSPRIKRAPPWLRARVVGPGGAALPDGTVGALVHVDLANRSSCLAIQTEDLGVRMPDGSMLLVGREQGAQLRGCSLDAEQLRALQPQL